MLVPSRCNSNSLYLFILVLDVVDDAEVCGIGALGGFVPVDEKICVSFLDVPYTLENSANLVGYTLAPFHFIGTFHEMQVFLCFFLCQGILMLLLSRFCC